MRLVLSILLCLLALASAYFLPDVETLTPVFPRTLTPHPHHPSSEPQFFRLNYTIRTPICDGNGAEKVLIKQESDLIRHADCDHTRGRKSVERIEVDTCNAGVWSAESRSDLSVQRRALRDWICPEGREMCIKTLLLQNSTGEAVWKVVVRQNDVTVRIDGYNVKEEIVVGEGGVKEKVWEGVYGGCPLDKKGWSVVRN